MLQNMKVDIIYYKSNSDFEMEFNLCGCCRMRLLTDKSPDRKTMVHSLARAVSRSRIIMIVGSLFGETGALPTVSEAIGIGLSSIDNKTYGIKSEEEIKIISGATPLVTPDGFFGGCIIESGPQTLILISDNKTVRKEIMHSLIHPYIEELYANELLERSANTEENVTETTSDNFEDGNLVLESDEPESQYSEADNYQLLTENDVLQESQPLEAEDPHLLSEIKDEDDIQAIVSNDEEILSVVQPENIEEVVDYSSEGIIMDDADDSEETSEDIKFKEFDIISDTDYDDYDFAQVAELAYMDQQDSEMLVENDDSDESYSRGYSLKSPILILTIVLLLTIVVLCFCIFLVPSSSNSTPTAFIKETFSTLFG